MRSGGGNKYLSRNLGKKPRTFYRAGVEYPLAVARNIFNHKERYFSSGRDIIRLLEKVKLWLK